MPTTEQHAPSIVRRAARFGLAVGLTALCFTRCEDEDPRVVIERDFQPIFVERQPATAPTEAPEAQAPQAAAPTTPRGEEGIPVEEALEKARERTAEVQPKKASPPDPQAQASEPGARAAQEGDDVVVVGGPDQQVRALPEQGEVAVIGAAPPREGRVESPPAGTAVADPVQAAPTMEPTSASRAADQEAPAEGESQGSLTGPRREAEAIDAVVSEVEATVKALNREPGQAKADLIRELKSEATELRGRIARARTRIEQLSPPVGSPGDRARRQVLFQLEQLRGRLDRATSRF